MRASAIPGAVVLALLALAAAAVPVAAHSDLVSSAPADGSTVAAAPAEAVLRFDNPVEPSATQVRVQDASGTRVASGPPGHSDGDRTVRVALPAGLGNGTYVIRWSILSEDGHPNTGRVTFGVGENTSVTPPGGPSEAPAALSVAGRALSYAGLALALGAAAWMWLVRVGLDAMRRPAVAALTAGAALHAIGSAFVFASTVQATGATAAVLASSATGRLLVVRMAAAAAAFVGAAFPAGRWRGGAVPRVAGVALMLVAAVATAAIGHAASHSLAGLLSDAMHLVSSATWVGGLALLIVALRLATRQGLSGEEVRRIGLRFGTVALACVIVLVLSGTVTAVTILGRTALTDPLHLLGGLYGRLLLAKVGLAVVMVGVAGLNRSVFLAPPSSTPRGLRARVAALGPDGTSRGLRKTVAIELALGVAVLAIAGALTAVSPSGHAAHADDHSGHDLHDPVPSTSATTSQATPGEAGAVVLPGSVPGSGPAGPPG